MKLLRAPALGAMLVILATSACRAEQPLVKEMDVPLPGRASRFDYQSFDPGTATLYFTHMGDGELVVFDTVKRKVVAHLPDFPTATGVLVVPELHRVFVSVAGRREVAVVDTRSLTVLARVPAGDFPDGLAHAPDVHKVFVSDLAVAPRVHSVSVNPENHEVYLPLENVEGRPVLRIMKPTVAQPGRAGDG